jgi:4-carboxymuconolactone decarboxylase
MDESERRAAGAAMRRKVLGDAHVDRATAGANAFTGELQDLITRGVWGEIWTRPGLDVRTRRVLVLGTLIALGRWDELRLHARAAVVEGGFSPDDLKEVALQQTFYCGVPAGRTAFEVMEGVLRDLGRLP